MKTNRMQVVADTVALVGVAVVMVGLGLVGLGLLEVSIYGARSGALSDCGRMVVGGIGWISERGW